MGRQCPRGLDTFACSSGKLSLLGEGEVKRAVVFSRAASSSSMV